MRIIILGISLYIATVGCKSEPRSQRQAVTDTTNSNNNLNSSPAEQDSQSSPPKDDNSKAPSGDDFTDANSVSDIGGIKQKGSDRDYGSKTTYQPRQDPATFEPPPAGYSMIYLQIMSRHSSRGLSSPGSDLVVHNMLQKAKEDGAITSLGLQLLADVKELMSINALLGFGIPGISKPGYGNLSAIGIREHRELGGRFYKRNQAYFDNVIKLAGTEAKREIEYTTSGVNRANDSANFFIEGMNTAQPMLTALIEKSDAVVIDPAATTPPVDGIDRFLLYFFKLNEKSDLITVPNHPYKVIFDSSQVYQKFGKSPELKAKMKEVTESDVVKAASRKVLEGLVSKDFLAKVETGVYSFSNTGTFNFTSSDGKFKATTVGDGEDIAKSLVDLAAEVNSVYAIAPALGEELGGKNYEKYVPRAQAEVFSFVSNAEDFYEKGPSTTESDRATSKMAQGLVDAFFAETDEIAVGDVSHAADIRFAHAETLIPLITALGLKLGGQPIPQASTFSHDSSIWRGSIVTPLTGNIQWEVYQKAKGVLAVKLLHNEKEVDFMPACASAKITPKSFYYDYAKLKKCYYP